jgi:hypothetical protein
MIKHPRVPALAAILLCLVAQSPPTARADLDALLVSPDLAVELGGTALQAFELAEDNLHGAILQVMLPVGFDPAADLAAHAEMPDGDLLWAFDRSFSLPDETVVERGDIVRFDGVDLDIVFAAQDAGVPPGAMVDAIAVLGEDLLLSFDVSIDVGGVVADDEDLVLFDGEIFSIIFDGSAAGVPAAVDVDAAHLDEANTLLLLSFDTSGEIDGISFDDEDVVGFQIGGNTWRLVYDSSAAFPAWSPADLDALSALFEDPTATATPSPTSSSTPTATFSPSATPTSSATASPTTDVTATTSPVPPATNTPPTSPTPRRPADLDGNGKVDDRDLEILIAAFFSGAPPAEADVNGDMTVSAGDLPALIRDSGDSL